MVKDGAPTRNDMRKAERDVGKNIPRGMIGLDSGDVRDVHLDDEDEKDDPSSRH